MINYEINKTASLLSIFLSSIMVCFKALRQGLQLIWVSLSKRMVTEPLDPYLHVHQ